MEDPSPLRLTFAAFELDEANALLSKGGERVPLTPKAFAVLCALARQAGKLVAKSDLLDAVWGHRHVSDSVLKTVVSELRAVLGDDAKQPRFIATQLGRGYRFIATPAPALAPLNGIVGRRSALDRALHCWARVTERPRSTAGPRAVTGESRTVWITGEAGIGKTTLIDLLADEARPARVGRGHCVEQFGATEPYLPVLEALGGLCRLDPSLPSLMRRVAPAWLFQMPWLCTESERGELQRELTGSHPDRMLREFCVLLDRYASEEPLLLVTEDLHWSDDATVRLIDWFARSRGPARVLWLGSFRPAEVIATDHPLSGVRHELRASGLCEEIALDPFSEREVSDYLAGRFSASQVSESFARSLHRWTDGLPLFVVNVVDDLILQGAIREGGAGEFPASVTQVPESVTGVIERRIARLAPELQSLLEAAAVCGTEFRAATLATLTGRDPEWLVDRCESLARNQYWLRHLGMGQLDDGWLDPRYRFRHALYREVFYGRLGAHTKATLHLRLARSLKQSREAGEEEVPAAEIAVHFEQGHDPLQAVRHYVEATENALERFAAVEAQQLIGRAMSVLPRCPPGKERLELEFALAGRHDATCALLAGFGSSGTEASLARARGLSEVLPQTPEHAWIAVGIGWGYFQRGDYASAQGLAGRVQAVAASHDDQALLASGSALAGSIATLQGELIECRRLLEQGLASYDRAQGAFPRSDLNILDLSVVMHTSLATVSCQRGLFEQARRHLEQALGTARTQGAPMSQMVAYRAAAALGVWTGRPDDVLAWADALARLANEKGMSSAEGPSLWFRGWALAAAGEPEAGQVLIEEGIASREKLGRLAGITHPIVLAAEARALAGQWAHAQALVDQGLQRAQHLDERLHVPELWLLQGRIATGTGRSEHAQAALLESLRLARAQDALWLELLALVALCEIDAGAPEHLDALRETQGRLREAGGHPPTAGRQHLLPGVAPMQGLRL